MSLREALAAGERARAVPVCVMPARRVLAVFPAALVRPHHAASLPGPCVTHAPRRCLPPPSQHSPRCPRAASTGGKLPEGAARLALALDGSESAEQLAAADSTGAVVALLDTQVWVGARGVPHTRCVVRCVLRCKPAAARLWVLLAALQRRVAA